MDLIQQYFRFTAVNSLFSCVVADVRIRFLPGESFLQLWFSVNRSVQSRVQSGGRCARYLKRPSAP